MLSQKIASCLIGVAGLMLSGAASATAVVCQSTNPLELRTLTVSPALVGGICLTSDAANWNPTQMVNALDPAITTAPIVHLDRDEKDQDADGWLNAASSFGNNVTSGAWTVAGPAWNTYQRLFLGFHFGNADGFGNAGDPNLFLVELMRVDSAGTFTLGGSAGVKLNGLSHINLIGAGLCTADPAKCGEVLTPDEKLVPEPVSLALVGIAMFAAGLARRRIR